MTSKTILYGVQGEGRGHATRSMHIIEHLMRQGHRVCVLSGGDALPVLACRRITVFEIPIFRYHYNREGRLCLWSTFLKNLPMGMGLLMGAGAKFRSIKGLASRMNPDLFISDFEPYLARFAPVFKKPLLSLDHQHFLTESMLPKLRGFHKVFGLFLSRTVVGVLGGRPDRVITSSFFHFPRRRGSKAVFVGPYISERLKDLQVGLNGHIAVYLKRSAYLQSLLGVLMRETDVSFEIFSDWQSHPPASHANIRCHQIDREAFLASLSSAHALITTAGNQVIGEAVFLGKPILVFPEPDVLEQELNAAALLRSGFGQVFELDGFTRSVFREFVIMRHKYAETIRRFLDDIKTYDGTSETLASINDLLSNESTIKSAFTG